MLAKLIIFGALALSASAIQITAPSANSSWTTSGGQVITWEAVPTDPQSLTIQLLPPTTGTAPVPIIIASNITTSTQTYTYTPSGDALKAGDGWRVGFVRDSGILAESGVFKVVDGDSSITASASGSQTQSATDGNSHPWTGSANPTSTITSGTSTSSDPAQTSPTGAASKLVIPGAAMIMVAGFMGVVL